MEFLRIRTPPERAPMLTPVQTRLRMAMICLLVSCGLLLLPYLLGPGIATTVPFFRTICTQVGYLAFIVGCGLYVSAAKGWLARGQAIVAAVCMLLAAVASIMRLSASRAPDPEDFGLEPGLRLLALSFIGFSMLTEEDAGRGYALPVLALILGAMALLVGIKPNEFRSGGMVVFLPLPVLILWM